MPNPFVKRQPNTSTTDVDRPVSITPVPEKVRGPNFPYRGYETHGVEPNDHAHNPEDYGWMEEKRGVVVQYETDAEPPDPIPVYVVQQGGRELRRFRVGRVTTDANNGQVKSMLGRDPLRRSVTIRNTSTDPVYIGHDQQSASPMHGYPLNQNDTLKIEGIEGFYAISSTTNACVLALYIDYVDEIDTETTTVRG